MAGSFELILNGTSVGDDFFTDAAVLEVEENIDLPGAALLTLPVTSSGDDDLTLVEDTRLKPFATFAVVATQGEGDDQCIFDGLVLSHKLHLETGTVASQLTVWGQDASWLMNLEEKVKEWVDVTDADVAASIFGDYGISVADENNEDDSPSHTESGHTLMQRGTDIQFLRQLARRNGKLCRVVAKSKPGDRIGYFAKPKTDGNPLVKLVLNSATDANVGALDFEWDVTRPSSVKARQALFNDADADGIGVEISDSGLALLDERSLAEFGDKPVAVMLAAPVDDAGELKLRAQAVLREAGWFARCVGEADADQLGTVLRVGTVVEVQGAGNLNSGKYFVWSVRHTIKTESHRMRFVLVRNAIGAAQSGGGGLLGGLT